MTVEDENSRMVVSPLLLQKRNNHTYEIDGAADAKVCKKRFLPFLFGVSVMVSAVILTANTAYTVNQLNDIRSKLQLIYQHVSELLTEVSTEHDKLVTIAKDLNSLYEYTHKHFREISNYLTRLFRR